MRIDTTGLRSDEGARGDHRSDSFILLVEDIAHVARAIRRSIERDVVGHPVLVASSVAEAIAILTERPARPPLCGAIVDYFLGDGTAIDVIDWMDRQYPLLPICVYSGSPNLALPSRSCAQRRIDLYPKDHQLSARLSDRVRTVFRDQHIKRAVRRSYLRSQVRRGALTEHQLRTLDAIFEGVAPSYLAEARALSDKKCENNLSDLRAMFGCTFLELRARYERECIGRPGSARPVPSPLSEQAVPSTAVPSTGSERRKRRPSALRLRKPGPRRETSSE